MAITEEVRHRVYEAIRASHGDEVANGLMEMLPPVGWADVATKQDLAALREQVATKADLKAEVNRLIMWLVPLNIGLAFAVARLA